MERKNPLDLDGFSPKTEEKTPISNQEIEQIAENTGFVSRQPIKTTTSRKKRVYKTGRNIQVNVKASKETVELLYQLADKFNCPIAVVFEMAVQKLAKSKN